jgi:hypothetical protein
LSALVFCLLIPLSRYPVPEPTPSTRLLTDPALLDQCRLDTFRSGGPGGQKRQKTSTAVRLTHLPTGIAATSTEWRTLTENKLHALRHLRLKLATDLREPIDLQRFEPPDWFLSIRRQHQIEASHRHPLYAAAAGLVLDLLKALAGNPAAVAVNLGLSTTAVIKLLEDQPHLWAAANHIRADLGMKPLTHRQ